MFDIYTVGKYEYRLRRFFIFDGFCLNANDEMAVAVNLW